MEGLIFEVRGLKVMLDAELARIYGVQTKALNQAVKRNAERFPEGSVFQLSRDELQDLERQIDASDPASPQVLHQWPHPTERART